MVKIADSLQRRSPKNPQWSASECLTCGFLEGCVEQEQSHFGKEANNKVTCYGGMKRENVRLKLLQFPHHLECRVTFEHSVGAAILHEVRHLANVGSGAYNSNGIPLVSRHYHYVAVVVESPDGVLLLR